MLRLGLPLSSAATCNNRRGTVHYIASHERRRGQEVLPTLETCSKIIMPGNSDEAKLKADELA